MKGSPKNIIQYPWCLLGNIMFLITLFTNVSAQHHKVMEYGEVSGLPQDYVYSLHQDAAGYLWIGTGDGLAKYDGKEFKIFSSSDSLCDNFITTSHINGNDSWFGHNNGGITHYDGKVFTKVVKEELGTGSITDIKSVGNVARASTQSGGIWQIGANRQTKLFKDPENPVSVFNIEFLSSAEIVAGTMEGVYIFAIENESSKLRLITMLNGLPDTKIQDLTLSGDKTTLYILTQDEGIFTFNTKQLSPETRELDLHMEEFIEGPQQIYEDNQL